MRNMYNCFFKRIFDILGGISLLLILAIPMLLIALITQWDSVGGAFFVQKRCGKEKQPFKILKFRTLPKDAPTDVPTNDLLGVRPTRWQRWLRRTSLDELPQVINILTGDMSFIGPRPVVLEEQELIHERDKYKANDVLPGLTGWAQVNGRDELDYVTKARLDGEYVSQMGLRMDIKCLFYTFFQVLRQEGIKEI